MLDIQPGLLVFEILTFLTLLFLLNRMLFRPLLGHIDGRYASLSHDNGAIEANLDEAKKMKDDAISMIAAAKKEGHAKIDHAVDEAKKSASIALEAQRAKLAKSTEEFMASLQNDVVALQGRLEGDSGSYKASIAKKLGK
jgi:F-type H+-transporting ATPase subunit b